MTADLMEKIRQRLAQQASEFGTQREPSGGTTPTDGSSNLGADATDMAEIARIAKEEAAGVISDVQLLGILRQFRQEHVGAGVLDELLRLPGVTDVLVTAPNQVWIDRGNGIELSEVAFSSDEDVRRLAVRLAAQCGRRLDDAQPFIDGHIPAGVGSFGVRVHAVLAPPSATATLISLRVLRPARRGLVDLQRAGLFPVELQPVLERIVQTHKSFIVAGGTGAGKTTLLSAMLACANDSERIVCIEDTPELMPNHPHVVKLVTRPANVEGAGAIGQQELVRQALRMRPDRVIVGEIRGAEVVDMLAALNTGHRGGAGTVHANSATDVPARFEALGLIGGLDREALRSQLTSAIDVVIVVARTAQGRRITEIGMLAGNPPRTNMAWSLAGGRGPAWEELCEAQLNKSKQENQT